jgi:hypothetical protein
MCTYSFSIVVLLMCVVATFHDLLPYLECYSYYLVTFIHKPKKKITILYIKQINSLLVKEKELKTSKEEIKRTFFPWNTTLPIIKKVHHHNSLVPYKIMRKSLKKDLKSMRRKWGTHKILVLHKPQGHYIPSHNLGLLIQISFTNP